MKKEVEVQELVINIIIIINIILVIIISTIIIFIVLVVIIFVVVIFNHLSMNGEVEVQELITDLAIQKWEKIQIEKLDPTTTTTRD